jgi:hypothetical protein
MLNLCIIGLTVLEYFSVFYVFFGRRKLTPLTRSGWTVMLASLLMACAVALYPAAQVTAYPLLLLTGYMCALILIRVVMQLETAQMLGKR